MSIAASPNTRSQVGQKRRLVRVTEANLRNGHLYLTGHLGFFPSESFGASAREAGEGRPLILDVAGLKDPVETDIPTDPRTGKPRHFFRRRDWVTEFFRVNKVKAGDFVTLEKVDRQHLKVYLSHDDDVSIFSARLERRDRKASDPTTPRAGNYVEVAGRRYPWPTKRPVAEYHGPSESPGSPKAISEVDWKKFRFIDLFAGIGGIRLGFEHVGGKCVFTSEWDEEAQKTYEANFGHKPHGDITAIQPESIPAHNVLLAGFPCQPFSIIGERKGFADTRGTLFFNVEEILRIKRPAAILLENVKQFKTHDAGRTYRTVIQRLTELGYYTHTSILNALHYGVPQRRERTFIVGFQADLAFEFPAPVPTMPKLAEVLEPDSKIDPKFIASQMIQMKRLQRLHEQGEEPFYPSVWHENKGGHLGVHPFSCAMRHNASYNYLLVNGKRRMMPRECLRMQGFPESFKMVVSPMAIRAQTGNSVAVPVIKAIATEMMRSLRSGVLRGNAKNQPSLF